MKIDMRIREDQKMGHKYDAFLDGDRISDCVAADEEEGYEARGHVELRPK